MATEAAAAASKVYFILAMYALESRKLHLIWKKENNK